MKHWSVALLDKRIKRLSMKLLCHQLIQHHYAERSNEQTNARHAIDHSSPAYTVNAAVLPMPKQQRTLSTHQQVGQLAFSILHPAYSTIPHMGSSNVPTSRPLQVQNLCAAGPSVCARQQTSFGLKGSQHSWQKRFLRLHASQVVYRPRIKHVRSK